MRFNLLPRKRPAAEPAAAPRAAQPQTAELLQRLYESVQPATVLWMSHTLPPQVLAWPSDLIVLSGAPKPPDLRAGARWFADDLGWMDADTTAELRSALADAPERMQLAWIDGHHSLHVVLSQIRVLVDLNPDVMLAFHDAVPPHVRMIGEHPTGDGWVGEVWMLFAWLKREALDATVEVYDTASTGFGLLHGVTGRQLAAVDPEQVRRDLAHLTTLDAIREALAPQAGGALGAQLHRRSARPGEAPTYAFATLSDLRHDPACEVQDLAAGRPFDRAPAALVADLSGHAYAHHLGEPWSSELSTVALVGLPPGCVVRGSLMVELPEHRLLLPRAARFDTTAAFAEQVLEARDPTLSSSHFFSGLNRNAAGGITVDETFAASVEGDVLWVTPDEWDNWGVWLLQTLPAIVQAERAGFDGRLLCRVARPWQHAFLRTFAPNLYSRLVPHDVERAYRVSGRTWVVAQELRNTAVTDFERGVFLEVVDRALAIAEAPAVERLFVSRLGHSRKHPKYRTLGNEVPLIEALAADGFLAVEPEGLDVLSQVALFARAREIVGLGGAAMFNAVFAHPGASVMDIESTPTWVEGHANMFATSELRYGVIFGQPIEQAGPHSRWRLDLDAAAPLIRGFFAG